MGLFSSVGGFLNFGANSPSLSGLGGTLNDITGVTSSAKQAQRYAVANAKLNNAFQKEFAQNAHQWEMADLKAAGLNPALTATGGSGASASGGGSFGGTPGISSGNPFEIASMLVGMKNQTNATDAQASVNKATALKIITMLPLEKEEKEKIIENLVLTGENIQAQTKYTNERARGFSESETNSNSISTQGGTSVLGIGGSASTSRSRTNAKSRTY